MPSSLHWWNWKKPQESFWGTFAKYTHAQQHSWASCGAAFQLHGPQYFRFPGVWCGDGSMQWNRHPTEAAWNEGFLAARNRSNLKDWISISAALAIIYTRTRLIFMSMTIARRRNNNGFLDTEEELYTRHACFLKTFDIFWLLNGISSYRRPVNQLNEMH